MPGVGCNVIDWCLALSLTALAEAQLAVYGRCCDVGRVSPAGYLLTLLETLPVAWRRRAPFPVILVSGGAAIAQVVIDSPVTDFSKAGVLVLCFTVASQSRQIVGVVMAALTPGGILASAMLHSRSTVPAEAALESASGAGYARTHSRSGGINRRVTASAFRSAA